MKFYLFAILFFAAVFLCSYVVLIPSCSLTENETILNQSGTSNSTPIYMVTIGAENCTPNSHNTSHQNNGFDELNVAGLSGLLADDQHVLDSEVLQAMYNAGLGVSGFPDTDLKVLGQAGHKIAHRYYEDATPNFGFYCDWVANYVNMGVNAYSGRCLTLGNAQYIGSNYGHTGQANPTFYINSDTNPASDTTQWISISHNQTEARIATGKGGISFWLEGNQAMYISANGTLYVDETYQSFDDYDDALLLKTSISDGDMTVLLEADIAKLKYSEVYQMINDELVLVDILENGYIIDLQKLIKLVAGATYQNREKVDILKLKIDYLESEIEKLKLKIK